MTSQSPKVAYFVAFEMLRLLKDLIDPADT